MKRYLKVIEALEEVIAAADKGGWDKLDPGLKKQRAAVKEARQEIPTTISYLRHLCADYRHATKHYKDDDCNTNLINNIILHGR